MRRACVDEAFRDRVRRFYRASGGLHAGILHQAGYATYVSNAYQPDYFNSTKAYTGIGFDKTLLSD